MLFLDQVMLLMVLTRLEFLTFLPVAVFPQYKREASMEAEHGECVGMSERRSPQKGQLRAGPPAQQWSAC